MFWKYYRLFDYWIDKVHSFPHFPRSLAGSLFNNDRWLLVPEVHPAPDGLAGCCRLKPAVLVALSVERPINSDRQARFTAEDSELLSEAHPLALGQRVYRRESITPSLACPLPDLTVPRSTAQTIGHPTTLVSSTIICIPVIATRLTV